MKTQKTYALKTASMAPKHILLLPLYLQWGKSMTSLPYLLDFPRTLWVGGLRDALDIIWVVVTPYVLTFLLWPLLVVLSPIVIPILAYSRYRTWVALSEEEFDQQMELAKKYKIGASWFW